MGRAESAQGWDDVVVGAGSAGAVLAARLSEQPDRRVLLIEAGPERAPAARTEPLGMATLAGFNWDFTALPGTAAASDRRYPYPVGKLVGGSSAINGAIALRGLPADFDGWADAGNPDWAWDKVLPAFAAIETDTGATGPEHGREGPIPVWRPSASQLDPTAVAFLEACRAQGIPDRPDLNDGGTGAGLVPSNAIDGRRISTAEAYLTPARHRPNLTVWDRCLATRVLLARHRAVGLEVRRGGRTERVCAGQVTLAAGGINTPVLLQRSGIGDAGQLQALGERAVVDLPGVGANLSEHAVMTVWAVPLPGVCRRGEPWHQVMARVATSQEAPADLGIFLASNMAEVAVPVIGDVLRGQMAVVVSAMLLSPLSRGTVTLPSLAPDAAPVITLRLATDSADIEKLMCGVRLVWSLVRSSPLGDLLHRVLLWTDRMVDTEALLRRAVSTFVTPMCHPAGTARMGPAADLRAVVDQHGRVHDVTDLLVCDASVLPSVPSAPPGLTCIMLAERVAGWMA